METIKFDKDITVMYADATSFPNGVLAAHQKLHALFPFSSSRRYFGLSRPENGQIQYKAAAEVIESGEAEKHALQTMVIKKGYYYAIAINNFKQDVPRIQHAFNELTSQPDIDPEGYCVEAYTTLEDMICMVRIKE